MVYAKKGEIGAGMEQKKEYGTGQYVITLIITLVALTLIVYLTFGSFYLVTKEDAVTIGGKSVSEESEKLDKFLLQGLDIVQVTGLVLDYMLQDGSTPEEIEDFLVQETKDYASQMNSSVTSIYGVYRGVYVDGTNWVPQEGYNPKERPWYRKALEGGGKPVIVEPYLNLQTNQVMISVSQLLSDGESVVSIDIMMDEMQVLAKRIHLNGNGYGFIINHDGLVVAHADETQKGKNFLTDEDMQASVMKTLVERVHTADGNALTMDIDGNESMVFSEVVQEDWFVILIVNTEDLFHKVQYNLIRNILISLIIFVVVVYFCTTSHYNKRKFMHYAQQLKEYQLTLEERVAEQTEEIKNQTRNNLKMRENVIEGMATLIESRDGNTGLHVRSTKKYVRMIVSYMNQNHLHSEEVTDEFTENISNAAALHDIGKIMISDTILNKPGRLTSEEFEIMKTHAAMGGEIVERILGQNMDSGMLEITKNVAQYHHEKWDGSGYPEGLVAEQIPLSARIMAVADVFDALVSKRVYKDKMSIDKAFSILQEDAGSHFDPMIVDVFFAIRKDVEAYLAQIEE